VLSLVDSPSLVNVALSRRMRTPVITVAPDTPLVTVPELLERHRISGLPVVLDGRLVGVLTTTDLVAEFDRTPSSPLAGAVARLMHGVVATIAPHAQIVEVAQTLARARVHRLLVVRESHLVGVISARDLLEDVAAAACVRPVAELMRADVRTADVGASIDTAIASLADARVRGIVVVDGERPVGVFTHREALSARKVPLPLRTRPIEHVMSREIVTVDSATEVARAAKVMLETDARRLLVVDGSELRGIVTALDLVTELATRREPACRALEDARR
jgi:CBS domain-containing protein